MSSIPRLRARHSWEEDQIGVMQVLRAQPRSAFRATDLRDLSDVTAKYVRRAVTINRDGVTPIDGVTITRRAGAYWYSWSAAATGPDFQDS